ncbi:carboxylating nicotinate-nucleotide diphosphorylase [SAR202 cluster bacterium AC-647-N09_OGT_505m]|nr:carboxylating nicotinate-nucleotide diphosphorylase [SAR202 cluster bacterium AC-647-N09_OGT_505m]
MLQITSSIKVTIERALAEDLGPGDITTDSLIPLDIRGLATIVAKVAGVIAGLDVALEVFRQANSAIETRILMADGSEVAPGDVVAEVEGSVGGILKGERVALNFLQRLSGIATETSRYVKALGGTKAHIIDTRKTVPGLRELEKYAVRVGGGRNHRYNLADGVLIKDNHIAVLRSQELTLETIIHRARENTPHTLRIEVEVETVDEAREALEAHADAILLDNMSLEEMRQVVTLANGRCLLEASGGINLETVRAVAETGVDLISVGALTHSVRALDISLDMK